jgi:hypothetical protein
MGSEVARNFGRNLATTFSPAPFHCTINLLKNQIQAIRAAGLLLVRRNPSVPIRLSAWPKFAAKARSQLPDAS